MATTHSRLLLVVTLLLIALGTPASGQVTVAASYKPPIVPIAISIDSNGHFSVSVTKSCATPVGTFSVGATAAEVEPQNTYFLVRSGDSETLYCIGAAGKLRARTKGDADFEFSNLKDYRNVIVIDVRSRKENLSLEFVPDDTAEYLARVHHGLGIGLKKTGELVLIGLLEDTVLKPTSITNVTFADLPKATHIELSVGVDIEYIENGETKHWTAVCEGQTRIEAMWLRECLRQHPTIKIAETEFDKLFGDSLMAFKDGSICFRSCTKSPHGLYCTNYFMAGDRILGVAFDDGFFSDTLEIRFVSKEQASYELNVPDAKKATAFVERVSRIREDR